MTAILVSLTWSGSLLVAAAGAAERPFDVGDRSQLFVDRALVAAADEVTFTLHPARKHPAGPWLGHKHEGPAGPMVLYDEEENVFKSWSTAAYNTSRDGLAWGEREANDSSWRYIVRVSVIKDLGDRDPARRFKLLCFGPNREFPPGLADSDKVTGADGRPTLFWYCKGYNTFVSRDGRTLAHLSPRSILVNAEGRAPGDMLNAYYDRRLGLFAAFVKTTSRETRFTRRRCFAVMTSKDFVNWGEARLVFVPDELDDARAATIADEVRPLLMAPGQGKPAAAHIYGVGGPIQTESCVIALLRVYCSRDKGDGPSEVQMAVSRDLARWERPFRAAFIPRGRIGADPETSDWDTCWFNNEGPAVEVGDEVWVYYSARNTPHDHPVGFGSSGFSSEVRSAARKQVGTKYFSGIGIAVWRRDRFVSVDAAASGGTLTTVPLVYRGSRLELNAATAPGGRIVVELLDKSGAVLARSRPFAGDALRHGVEWESPVDLGALAGRPVSLRFRIAGGQLYAFAFRGE